MPVNSPVIETFGAMYPRPITPIVGIGAVTSVVAAAVRAGLSIEASTLLYFRSTMNSEEAPFA